MEAPMKYICVLGFLLLLGIAEFEQVDGAGECGKSSPDAEALKLAPCASAAMDDKATPSDTCCLQVKKMGQNPPCLCAVMLSDTAKSSGVKPEIAVTIPKRCNLADRPVGYKCGEMEAPMKYICVLGFLLFLGITNFDGVGGAGECGKSSTDAEALKLAPCGPAAMDANATPSSTCCLMVKKLDQNPPCLCAVMLSNTAKISGVKPEVAMTISKRCNIADRPIGYKCGAYTLP
ncbi:hypothetical protein CsSME_00000877 [Camellia sinensis var. sinensis]